MEKYTDWRDKGTGIAPFLPPTVGSSSVGTKTAYIALLVLKTILISPLIALYAVSGSKTLFGVISLVLFHWKVDVTVQGVKRRLVTKEGHYPHANTIYLCNSSSAVDAHVLDTIANGRSSFLVASENLLFRMDKSQYMEFALDGSLNVKKYGKEIHSIEALKGRVIFVFPEGTCSNGKSVLPFQIDDSHLTEILDPSNSELTVQAIHLKVTSSLATPLRVSKWEFATRAAMHGIHAKVKIHEPQRLAPLESVRVVMNDGNKFKLVAKTLGLESKRKFVEAYEKN